MEFRKNAFPHLNWLSVHPILWEDHFTFLSSWLSVTFIFILRNVWSLSVSLPSKFAFRYWIAFVDFSRHSAKCERGMGPSFAWTVSKWSGWHGFSYMLHITCTFFPFNRREPIFAVLSNTLDRNQIDFIKIFITGILDMSPFTSLCSRLNLILLF